MVSGLGCAIVLCCAVISRCDVLCCLQNAKRKLETLMSGALGGYAAMAHVCLPGRAMLPAGINNTFIPIYDSEPTSIIAYCLSTRDYQLMLNAAIKAAFQVSSCPGSILTSAPSHRFHVTLEVFNRNNAIITLHSLFQTITVVTGSDITHSAQFARRNHVNTVLCEGLASTA